jgi:thioester reductase-like protein
VTVLDIMRSPTIRAQALLVAGHGAPAYDAESVRQQMLADARLPDWFHLGGRPARTAPAHILLTGASGFVGAHLLDELLRVTDAAITCLVNASDGAAAGDRLNSRAQRYGLQLAAGSPRVTVLRGDLAAGRFGLSADRFDALAAEIDTIVHAGAEVNLLQPYRRLRAVNVEGTREVLRLAVTGRMKPIHHVSTLGILPRPAEAADLWLDEQTFPGPPAVPPVGYEQTKWVAESLLRAAGAEGLPVNVYRLGEVMPHTGTGVFSHGGSLAEFILEACVELGVRIETGAASDFTPVDNVCRFVAAAVRRGETGHCFHVVQPEPLRLDDLIGHFGARFALEPVDYAAFAALVADRAAAGPPQAGVFARLAAVLPPPAAGPPAALSASFRPIPEAGFSDRCRKLSQLMDVHWIPVDRRVFETYALSFRAG